LHGQEISSSHMDRDLIFHAIYRTSFLSRFLWAI
jgi:hypothetical protein